MSESAFRILAAPPFCSSTDTSTTDVRQGVKMLSRFGGSSLATRRLPVHPTSQLRRFKSSAPAYDGGQRRDDFPYSRLDPGQLEQMSADLSSSPIALRAFFSQHRPLMYMPVPPSTESIRAQEIRDRIESELAGAAKNVMYVNVWQPGNDAVGFHEHPFRSVPHNVAGSLGAFDLSKTRKQLKQDAEGAEAEVFATNAGRSATVSDDIRKSLQALTGLLERRGNVNGMYQLGAGGLVKIETQLLNGDDDGSEVVNEDSEIAATSVRRKRKLKMNRHKYRKRLKQQRALRRRLGK